MLRRLALLLIASLGLAAAPASAQLAVHTPDQALGRDAADYARRHGVDEAEAARRLHAQQESIAATDLIQRTYGPRLAGIWFEHRPDLRIIVLLTGSARVADRAVEAGGMRVPILFRAGARATREQVLAALRRHQRAIREAMPDAEGMGHDPRSGSLVVMADSGDLGRHRRAEMEARLAALTHVPVRIQLLDASDRNLAGKGGTRVEGQNPGDAHRSFCTTGFTVTDGRRTGIVTAAHCPDSLIYLSPEGGRTPLEFVGQWGAQFQDVQVHLGAGLDRPLFYSDTRRREARPLTGARLRAATRAGETVCHRGEASGYSCAEIEYVDYAPPGDLCGGPCHPVWVAVHGPTCRAGDSGGPVFLGTTAYGIVKGANYAAGGRCNYYYYMSTDYLPPGWSLLLESSASTSRDASGRTD